MLTYVTGLFLVFAGMIMGYFLSRNENNDADDNRKRLHKENSDLRNSLNRGKTTLAELEDKYSRQNGQLNVLQQLCDDWSSSREEAERDRSKLELLVSDYQTRSEDLTSQLQAESQRRIQAEDELHRFQQEQAERFSAIESNWTQRYAGIETSLTQQKAEFSLTQNEKTRIADQLHNAQARIAELMSELGSQKTMYQTACSNATGLKKEYTSLETSVQDLRDNLKESESNCAKAISAKRLAEESLRSANKQLEQRQQEIVELQSSLASMNALKQQYSSLESSLSNSDDRLKIVTTERDRAIGSEKAAHEHMIGLQKQIENQEATIQTIRSKHDEALNNLRLELEKRAELDRETGQRLMESVAECERLKMANLQESDQRSHFALSWEQSTAELEQFKAQCQKLQAGLEAETEQKVYFETAWKQNSEEIVELRTECERLQSRISGGSQQVEGLNGNLQELRDQLAEEKQLRGELETRKDELETALVTLKSRCDAMMVELSELQSIRDQHAVASDKWKEYRIRLEQTISQRDSSLGELSTYRREIENLRHQLANANVTIAELRDRLTALETQRESDSMILSLSQARQTVDHEYGGETRMHRTRGRVFTSRPQTVDDLKLISGVATVLEGKLNDYGVYTFRQIMEWDKENISEFQELLPAFKDRIERDDWLGQAAHLYDHFHNQQLESRAA